MTNGMAIKLSLLGFAALGSLAVHQALRHPPAPQPGKAAALPAAR